MRLLSTGQVCLRSSHSSMSKTSPHGERKRRPPKLTLVINKMLSYRRETALQAAL